MTEPLISVIVPTFNRPDWLKITLQSLMHQTYQNWEAVVVNDAGEDVEKVVSMLHDRRIRYFSHDKNKGLAGTRNTAMTLARGDYFCWLDDDDIYLPLALEFRIDQIKKRNAEIVYTRALQNIYQKKENGYELVHRQLYWDSAYNPDQILVMNIAPCCCPLFSRKAWEDTGNYRLDESMSTSEDHDFWIALSRHNAFQELLLVDSECSYRQDMTQMTGTRDFSKNWITIYKRWRDTAINKDLVKLHQNSVLMNIGINPEDYGL